MYLIIAFKINVSLRKSSREGITRRVPDYCMPIELTLLPISRYSRLKMSLIHFGYKECFKRKILKYCIVK
uniref:Uncharacterized protein n=1 Tax=Pararge aegeria TaxID=116150 RepID=S4PJL2_9NEOP